MENFKELKPEELNDIDGGFVISMGCAIVIAAEVFVFAASETFLIKENQRLDREMGL